MACSKPVDHNVDDMDVNAFIDQCHDSLAACQSTDSPHALFSTPATGNRKQQLMDLYVTPMDSSVKPPKKKRARGSPMTFEDSFKIVDSIDEMRIELSAKMSLVEDRITTFQAELDSRNLEIEVLQRENVWLKEREQLHEGRVTRLEKLVEDLHEEVLKGQARSMKNNLIFTNIAEKDDENVKQVLSKFMKDNLKMSDENVQEIKIVSSHRMGKKQVNYSRPIVANIAKDGHGLIMSKTKNLHIKDQTKQNTPRYSVFPQLPRELAERKKMLYPIFKQAKFKGQKARWSGASLYVDGKLHEVKKDSVKDLTIDVAKKALDTQVFRAPPQWHGGSAFQGCRVPVKGTNDIVPALHAIVQDPRVARASHTFYAYRIKTSDGVIEHYEDDGEFGAGATLLDLLRKEHIIDQLLGVSRWNGPNQLGPSRFDHFEESATMALWM